MSQRSTYLLIWLAMTSAVVAAGDSALPGNHPLTQAQAGELLIAELRCTACHAADRSNAILEKSAPDLSEAGSRIAPEYLRKFIAAPSAIHPGTTMPDMLSSQEEAERDRITEALTHFLIAQSKGVFTSQAPDAVDREHGKQLFHSVGCVACHGPREMIDTSVPTSKPQDDFDDDPPVISPQKTFDPVQVNLGHVAGKYSVKSLSEFLFQPLRVRPSGRMPDMKLTPDEALAVAGYLAGERNHIVLDPQDALVAQGREYFQKLNCTACHQLPGITPAPLIGSLKSANLTRGCLSAASGRSPQFHLNGGQVQAIIASLQSTPEADSDSLIVASTLTRFRCIACHVRDDFGGVPQVYDPYFIGSEVKMGDDGRIPPPLTLVGAKLQPAWMKKVLFDGESVRPYMATRMPQYGVTNLQHLPEAFARLDLLEGRDLKIPNPESRTEKDREQEKLLRAAGRELLGDKGLNCVACHNFNGKPGSVNQGIDLLTTYPRLQPAWFDQYVRNPMAFRPRTVMPSAWSNGVASHKTILDGNTDQQIEAVWYYLSLGTSAADPPGVRGVSTKLDVEDVARIHRGRSRVAGFRGIAVGLPEKLSYAFNAETGTLSAIWTGDFVGVNWNGQGSGDFNPASEPILLAQDVSFAQLADEQTPWPLMPIMTKEAKLNTNPLYPKNVGYQFRGYYLDSASIPTFMYRSGAIEIEDRLTALNSQDRHGLKRVLKLTSPERNDIWFRALTGQIEHESDCVYRSGRIRLTVPESEVILRAMPDKADQSELLLHLKLPQGESRLEFLYEPLGK